MKIEDFIDLDGSFEQGKSNIILTGKKAVDNQIFNLFTTTSLASDAGTGERIFEPTYGGNLEQFLFYPFDDKTGNDICDFIYDQITDNLSGIITVTRQSISYQLDFENMGYIISIYYVYAGKLESVKFAIRN